MKNTIRRTRKPFSKERFRYAKKMRSITHEQLQKASGVTESTYFMDFRKNYCTTDANLDRVAMALDVSISYLKCECSVQMTDKAHKYQYWKSQNRIDPEGNFIPPYDWITPQERTWIMKQYAKMCIQTSWLKEWVDENRNDNHCKATGY